MATLALAPHQTQAEPQDAHVTIKEDVETRASAQHATDILRLIAFAEAARGYKIAEFMAADASRIGAWCDVVGESGHVYAIDLAHENSEQATIDTPATCHRFTRVNLEMQKRPAPETWSGSDDPGVVYEYWSHTPAAENFAAPEPLDVIWIAGHYHDLYTAELGSPRISLVHRAWWQALKPGGVLIVEDHAAATGSAIRDVTTLHRIDPEYVKRAIVAAGFEYVGRRVQSRKRSDQRDSIEHFVLKFRKVE